MEKKEIVIIGAGRYSKTLIERLKILPKVSLIVIDKKAERLESITGVKNIIVGDATNEEFIKGIGIENADYYIIGVGSDFQASLLIATNIKQNFTGQVIAKSVNEQHESILNKIGVEDIVTPEIAAAKRTFSKIINPLVRKGWDEYSMLEVSDNVSIVRVPVKEEWIKKTVKDIVLPKGTAIFLIYKKGTKATIVTGLTEFNKDDIVTIVGENKALIKFLNDFEKYKKIKQKNL